MVVSSKSISQKCSNDKPIFLSAKMFHTFEDMTLSLWVFSEEHDTDDMVMVNGIRLKVRRLGDT